MGIDALRAALEAEGAARVARVREEAEAEVARLRERAEAEASRRRRAFLEREGARLRREAAARVAKARTEAQRRVLEARDAILDQLFARAAAELPSAAESAGCHEALVARAHQALAHMPEGAVTITGSPGVLPVLERAFAGRAAVRLEGDPELPAGFRVTGARGALIVDATLEKRLELERPRLAIELLRRLETSGASGGAR